MNIRVLNGKNGNTIREFVDNPEDPSVEYISEVTDGTLTISRRLSNIHTLLITAVAHFAPGAWSTTEIFDD